MYLSLSFSEQNGKNCGSFTIGLILCLIMVYINNFRIILSLMIMLNQLYNIRERRIFRAYYDNKLYNIGTGKDFLEGFIYRITFNNSIVVFKRLSNILIILNDKSYFFNKFICHINNKLNDVLNGDIYEAIISKQDEIFRAIYNELYNDYDFDKDSIKMKNMYLMFPKTLLKKFNPYKWFNNGYDLSMENVFLSKENENKIEFISDDLLNKLLIVEYLIVLIGIKMKIIRTFKKADNIHKAVVYGLYMIEDLEIMLNMIDNDKLSDDIFHQIKNNFKTFMHNINIFLYDLVCNNFENEKINSHINNYLFYDNQSYDKYKDLLLIFKNL